VTAAGVGGKAARRKKGEKRECACDAWGQAVASVRGRRGVARRMRAAVRVWARPRCGLAEDRVGQVGTSGPCGPCGLCWGN
jgi:hypothetical protein